MHSLYFVHLKEKGIKTSEEAQQIAENVLNDNSFAGEGGFYSSSKSDWFVVGGRWSGTFTQHTEAYQKALEEIKPLLGKKELESLDYLCINPHLVEDKSKHKKIDDIFIKHTGLPFFRDTYKHGGQKDDAVQITPEILKLLKGNDYKNVELAVVNENGYIEEETLAGELTKSALGDWLVIIDYHF